MLVSSIYITAIYVKCGAAYVVIVIVIVIVIDIDIVIVIGLVWRTN